MSTARARFAASAAAILVLALSGLVPVLADSDEFDVYGKAIRWAVLGRVEPAYQQLAKQFEQAKGLKVEILPYQDQAGLLDLLLDKKPDVLTMSTKTALDYIDIGMLSDVHPYYKGSNDFTSDVMTQFGRNFSKKGKVYALPFGGKLTMLNYNRDAFKAAGYPEPQPSWKFENELYAALRKLTLDRNGDHKPEQYGMVGGVHNQWLPVFYSWGAEFLSMDGLKLLFTDKAALGSLTYVQKLHQEGLVQTRDPSDEFAPADGPFADGRTAMFMTDRIWDADYLRGLGSMRKADFGYTSTPYGPKGNVSVATSGAIGLYVQSPNKKGAADFIKFLFDDTSQVAMYQAGAGFPTRKNVLKLARLQTRGVKKDDPIADSYEKSKVMGADDISQMILDNVNDGVYQMVSQGVTPAELMQQAKQAFYDYMKGQEK